MRNGIRMVLREATMRLSKCALLLVPLFGSAVVVRGDETSAAPQKPEGRWLVVHRVYTPSEITANVGKLLADLGNEVEIKNGRMSACNSAKAGFYLLVDFRPKTTPKAVDLKVPGQNERVLLGIYRMEGDVMSLAISAVNKRPDRFTNPRDQVLLVLKRPPKKLSQ
jgi:hypothetical protein